MDIFLHAKNMEETDFWPFSRLLGERLNGLMSYHVYLSCVNIILGYMRLQGPATVPIAVHAVYYLCPFTKRST